MPGRVVRIVALLAALLLVGAACGDSGIDGLPTSPTSASSGNGNGANGDDGTGIGDVFSGTTLADLVGLSSECQAVIEVIFGFGSLVGGGAGADAQAFFRSAADDLPSDLRDDIEVIASAAEDFSSALEDLGIDLSDPNAFAEMTPEDSQRYAEAAATLSTDEVNEAFANIEAHGDAECATFGGLGD